MYAIGLMSGTSLDGLDVALCDITGNYKSTKVKLIDFICLPMPVELKQKIMDACDEVKSNNKLICSLDFELGYYYLEGVKQIIKKNKLKNEDITFVASHGQTIYHLPNPDKETNYFSSTLQIGQASVIAYETGIKVVNNFRVMDVAAGGQGAPLVPYADFILYSNRERSVALQNIGGIANVTFLKKNGEIEDVVAFDNGTGNMLINEAVKYFFNKDYDENGEISSKGNIIGELLYELQNHPYIKIKPPKSTGREEFGKQFFEKIINKYENEKAEDIVHTFTYYTAWAIKNSYEMYLEEIPNEVIVGGGGAYNRSLMNMLKSFLPDSIVKTQEDIGGVSEAKEAIAFVILGNETIQGNTSNVPSATGAKRRVVLGSIV